MKASVQNNSSIATSFGKWTEGASRQADIRLQHEGCRIAIQEQAAEQERELKATEATHRRLMDAVSVAEKLNDAELLEVTRKALRQQFGIPEP